MKAKILFMLIIAMAFIQLGHAQITITGTVTSAADDGMPLPGVTIMEKGTSNGTVSDMNGAYSIIVQDSTSILLFSFMGMNTAELPANGKKVVDIQLASSDIAIDDVVVTAFGIKRQSKSMSYSSTTTSKAKSNNIIIRGNSSLGGKVSGMEINSSKGTGFKKIEKTKVKNEIGKDNESYSTINENEFKTVKSSPLSTFSIDVDRASYSNVRRFINQGQKPPVDAVRIEEMINYFSYDYPEPEGNHPIAVYSEIAACPWQVKHKLLHIGLQGKKISTEKLPPSNIVFLIDVSGSMSEENKLPLLKEGFKFLVNNLREKDKVSIVVYAGAAGMVLAPTYGTDKQKIIEALDKLQSGGSTAGGEGINLAYSIAKENFIENGNNRVILATDGDFNVGSSSDNEMERLIEEKRKDGIFLTCLGFGMGNYKDSKMETLADKGNGNYAYIDNIEEAKKTLVSEFGSTLFVIAKDVKLQIEFNPLKVQAYRLIGYENRLLNDEDFDNDAKDAGEMGAGHTVTALYEIIPVGVESEFIKSVGDLKYQTNKVSKDAANSGEMANLSIRYKEPKSVKSIKFVTPIQDVEKSIENCSSLYRFSASVALFGMLLCDSKLVSNVDYQTVLQLASNSKGIDNGGYRNEFIELVKRVE